jgi:hypothetical protein
MTIIKNIIVKKIIIDKIIEEFNSQENIKEEMIDILEILEKNQNNLIKIDHIKIMKSILNRNKDLLKDQKIIKDQEKEKFKEKGKDKGKDKEKEKDRDRDRDKDKDREKKIKIDRDRGKKIEIDNMKEVEKDNLINLNKNIEKDLPKIIHIKEDIEINDIIEIKEKLIIMIEMYL